MAARALKTRQLTGICITASHNPAPDNGVKLVEPTGEMLCQEWEVREWLGAALVGGRGAAPPLPESSGRAALACPVPAARMPAR